MKVSEIGLRFLNPEGWQKVAGGRSSSWLKRPPEQRTTKAAHPGGMPEARGESCVIKRGHCFRSRAHRPKRSVWHPSGMQSIHHPFTGGRSLGGLGTTTGYHLASLRDATYVCALQTTRQ